MKEREKSYFLSFSFFFQRMHPFSCRRWDCERLHLTESSFDVNLNHNSFLLQFSAPVMPNVHVTETTHMVYMHIVLVDGSIFRLGFSHPVTLVSE